MSSSSSLVLDLVSNRLDPQTLASASCVCKSWSISMSADHLWRPICAAAFPFLVDLRSSSSSPLSYRKTLFSWPRCRGAPKVKLHISMQDLHFAIDIQNGRGCVATVVTPGDKLKLNRDSEFRFDRQMQSDKLVAFEYVDKLKIMLNVVLRECEGVFRMIDGNGEGSCRQIGFSRELPLPVCCSRSCTSGLVEPLRVHLWVKLMKSACPGKVVVEEMSVGVLNIRRGERRYVSVGDVLRYLQHFL